MKRARSSSGLHERFPRSAGPRTDDICYATTNRQAAVKQMAGDCDLMLVIGSRNSSNSVRLVEVAHDCGTEAYLIDHAGEVREEWLAGKRVVGVSSGASAPDDLVQDLLDFFRARGVKDISEFHVVREDVRFMLPKPIREAVAAALDGSVRVEAAPARALDGMRTLVSLRSASRRRLRCRRAAPSRAALRTDRRARRTSIGLCCSGTCSSCATDRAAMRLPPHGRSSRSSGGRLLGVRSWSFRAITIMRSSSLGRGGRDEAPEFLPLGLEQRFTAEEASSMLATLASWAEPASLSAAYPGLWLRPDVYATHGHYLDCHLSIPTMERLGIGMTARVQSRPTDAFATVGDYEAVTAPVFAWIDAVARQAPTGSTLNGQSTVRVWRALAGERGETAIGFDLRARALAGAFPFAIAALNRAGIGSFQADISTAELRRAGLRAMGEVAARLGLGDAHVIFGHTHRAGSLPGDVDGGVAWASRCAAAQRRLLDL